ncbi:MAG: hypothetical protein CVU39_06155 [Chloroflexi bacterium HGW-Chloroflexi-10]|nr:MAG: hypothetical protein CVU39_06155 [Chloroflexi bacterium HGW-Chloroflexi-10]
MAFDILAARGRVEAYLMDAARLVWDDDVLDEAIRQALRDVQAIWGTKLGIEGLDGELVTSLDAGMADLIVRGAASYAVEMRTVDRADVFELSQTGLELAGWAAQQKKNFWDDVEKLRLKQIQTSASAPYFTLPDPD